MGLVVLASSATGQTVINDTPVASPPGGGGSPWDFSGAMLRIGDGPGASGSLTVTAGTEVLAGGLEMGAGASSSSGYLAIEGAGAVFRTQPHAAGSEFFIGLDGYGEVEITNGGRMRSRVQYVAFGEGSSGQVTVEGAGSVWDVGGVSLRVGQRGEATVRVRHGGSLQNFTDAFLANLSHEDSSGKVTGGGVAEVWIESGGTADGSGSARIGNRPGTNGTVTVRGEGSQWSMNSFLHVGSGGSGTLRIEDGGKVIIGESISMGSAQRAGEEDAVGHVSIEGIGSRLESGTWMSVGRGAVGSLWAENGGLVKTNSYLRLGEDPGSLGEAFLSGAETRLEVGGFAHVGFNGEGALRVADGAVVELPNGVLYLGRNNGSVGEVTVRDAGSRLAAGGLRLGTDPSGQPTGGSAVLSIEEGAVVEAGEEVIAAGNGSILLNGGSLLLTNGATPGSGGTLRLLETASLSGNGFLMGNLRIAPETVTVADENRIVVSGSLSGTGAVESLTLGGLEAAASTGPMVLRDVDFSSAPGPASVSLSIDGPVDGLITHDAATDFSGGSLIVSFPAGEPSPAASFRLFVFEGEGEGELNFNSISLPAGWILENGWLRHGGEGAGPVFAEWAASHGLSGLEAGPEANPAGDGFSNLAKFAFGQNPLFPTASLVTLSRNDDQVRLRWNLRTDETVSYLIETKGGLAEEGWMVVHGAEPWPAQPLDRTPPAGYERVEWTATAAGERAFFRIRAEVDGEILVDPPIRPEDIITIEGTADGEIHFEPITLQFSVEPGFPAMAWLNGNPHTGAPVSSQGLHEFTVTATGPGGESYELRREFFVLDPNERAPHHTMAMEYQLVRWVRSNPHVRPTASADEWLVLGQSKGWPANPHVPVHDLHGFQITDLSVPDEDKIRVVLSDGNHPVEHTGSWGHRGIVNFLISGEPEAEILRRLAVFYIYPMVNPDGRYLAVNRNNPELAAAGESDHNRVWNTVGQFSTIDVLTNAMRVDTGGTADYLLDFHSAGSTFFYALPEMMDTPLARAITRRDPEVLPRASAGHPGMLRIWSMSGDGLSVKIAYTPEFRGSETAKRSLEMGRNYGLAFHDLFTGESVLAEVAEWLEMDPPAGFGRFQWERLREAKEELEDSVPEGRGRLVLEKTDLVFERALELESALAMIQAAVDWIDSTDSVLEYSETGFGALYQNTVQKRIDAVETVLGDPEGTLEMMETALSRLSASVDDFWLIQAGAPFPEVVPVLMEGPAFHLTLEEADDWMDGFLVNLSAGPDGLMPTFETMLEFNGAGDHVTTTFFPGEPVLGDRFTWEFWKNHRSFANNTGSSGSSGTSPRFYTQLTGAGGALRTAIGDAYWNSATLGEPGRWHHIAIVYDHGEVRTHVDGILQDIRTGVDFSGQSASPFTIGRGFGNARWLNGFSREHRVWTIARSETELRLNRNRSLSGTEEGLHAYWKINEGSGNTVLDHAGGNYPGTIHGAKWAAVPQPGFRLSHPFSLFHPGQVNHGSIEWETAGAGEGESISVWIGSSSEPSVLPTEWREAVNGGPVPYFEPGAFPGGNWHWLKIGIDPSASGTVPRLSRLHLSVD